MLQTVLLLIAHTVITWLLLVFLLTLGVGVALLLVGVVL